MRRFALLLVLGLGFGAGLGAAVAPEQPARAVSAAQVVGVYQLRIRGEGFHRSLDGKNSVGRVRAIGEMRIIDTDTEANDGEFEVEIRLHPKFDGTLFDKLTPSPAFRGRGVLVGDNLTVIGTSVPNFVNALVMRFQRKGRKVVGTWLASYPATVDAVTPFAGGAGVSFVGKRVKVRAQAPAPDFSFSQIDAAQSR